MAYFICEKQGRCCPHEFYDSIEQAITDSEDGVPCDHLIEVAPVRHGRWKRIGENHEKCTHCGYIFEALPSQYFFEMNNKFCRMCGAKMDSED